MKLQGKDTGKYAGFIGWTDSGAAPIDLEAGSRMLTVHYKDAGKDVYANYKTIAGLNANWEDYAPAEPTTQQLEDSIKELDERIKTVEEITERLLREDNEQILGKVKQYEPGMPPREEFERMKEQLREWIEKEPKTEHIEVNFIINEEANDGRKGIQFIDADSSRLFDIIFWDWPRIGLKNGAVYTPDELLITGEAGKE